MYDIIRKWAIDNKINVTAGQGRLLELLVEEKFKSTNTGSPKLRQTIELVNSVICGLDDPVFAKDIDVIKFRLKNVVSQLSGNA
jgi:hypothetical protein